SSCEIVKGRGDVTLGYRDGIGILATDQMASIRTCVPVILGAVADRQRRLEGAQFSHCLLPLENPHYVMPMNDRPLEQPRSEPEIIPPGVDERSRRESAGLWLRIEEHDGVRRVVITQPGPAAIVLGVMILCLIAGIAFLVVAGLLLFWIP